MHLDRTSRRILGALVEKRWSTPEQYPLTLNAVVLACNQKSNRDPETQLEEFLVEGCLRQLRIDGWITVVERDFGRAVRYAERMSEQLGLSRAEAAVLAELLLRGPQTEQELQRRCERMVSIASVDEALALLRGMAGRGLVEHLPREVGQRIARWRHLLTPPGEEDASGPPAGSVAGSAATPPGAPAPARPVTPESTTVVVPMGPPAPGGLAAPTSAAPEVEALRREVESLRAEITALREEIAHLRAEQSSAAIEFPKRPGSPYL